MTGQRGRPRKIQVEPATGVEQLIAARMQEHCYIPGCKVEFHVDDAREMVQELSNNGYKIIKE